MQTLITLISSLPRITLALFSSGTLRGDSTYTYNESSGVWTTSVLFGWISSRKHIRGLKHQPAASHIYYGIVILCNQHMNKNNDIDNKYKIKLSGFDLIKQVDHPNYPPFQHSVFHGICFSISGKRMKRCIAWKEQD